MSAGVPFELFKTEFGSGADLGWLPTHGLRIEVHALGYRHLVGCYASVALRILVFGWYLRSRTLVTGGG